ncbi:MAG: HAD-IC family P-type ATPase [Clostridia bacterium]
MVKENLDFLDNVQRYTPDISKGLTLSQVNARKKDGLVNYDTSIPTKSMARIIKENTITLFNILNILLAIALIYVGSYKNIAFLGIVVCNTLISIAQEIHSKRIVDKLSVLSATKVQVKRNNEVECIGIEEIVLDDIIQFRTGNQVVTDCVVMNGEVEVNESFITGESNAIFKKVGDTILSGSFIVSGNCIGKVEHIGRANYTSAISSEAKYIKKVKSEIMGSLNKIIKFASIVIVPLGLVLFLRQLNIVDNTLEQSVESTVAAVIGMIPEGLVLLTSTVLAVSVIRLSKKKVLVQELYCIETLARVDTLCLDKTGTITEGKMEVSNTLPISSKKEEMFEAIRAICSASQDNNATIDALRDKYTSKSNWIKSYDVPFSSDRKWSGIAFEKKGSFVIGAPEFVLKDKFDIYKDSLKQYIEQSRVIVLAHSKDDFRT